jgi:hypothetical protein
VHRAALSFSFSFPFLNTSPEPVEELFNIPNRSSLGEIEYRAVEVLLWRQDLICQQN